jgi:hypothetical protein
MSRFEDRLLTYLVAEHGDALLDVPPRPARAVTRRRRWLSSRPAVAALALLIAAAVAVIALTVGGRHAVPAYALKVRANGTVVLTLNDVTGVKAANDDLAARGLPIRVIPLVKGCRAVGRPDVSQRGSGLGARVLQPSRTPSGGVTWTIDPKLVPHGDVLGLGAQRGPGGSGVVGLVFEFFRGRAPSCLRPLTFHVPSRPGARSGPAG